MSVIPQEVASLFETLTFDLINRGYGHYSADAILHRIRWHFHVDKGDREFKCNNNWTAALARDFMNTFPQHAGFFRTRKSPHAV